jgi:hypothetical protein
MTGAGSSVLGKDEGSALVGLGGAAVKEAENMREGATVVGGVKNERSSSVSRKSLGTARVKV